MKQLLTAAGVAAALAFAMPAFAAQDTAPGTSVHTGAAASNQINGSAESNPANATASADAAAKNKTVARVSTPDPMMSRFHQNDKAPASTSTDTLNQSIQSNGQY
jgi:hypothetical protein